MKVRFVALKGMPPVCCCCGAEADTAIDYPGYYVQGNKRHSNNMKLPYCRPCRAHAEYMQSNWFFILLVFLTLGLFYLVVVAINKFVKEPKARREMAHPGCTRMKKVFYTYSAEGHTFEVECPAFVRAVAEANPDCLHRTPEVEAFLNQPAR
ncbi:MAG TPA: hypothetical protein PK668_10390 [Myxococcota bacterium]|nr:hypothetical protein [Myxococcota bacterium]HRY93429.1 hypothetical protein [Myxococcota bacterium]HSA22015.1 hypothetical protein [Myxococcota bacterium]